MTFIRKINTEVKIMKYTKPVAELEKFEVTDVVTTSALPDEEI